MPTNLIREVINANQGGLDKKIVFFVGGVESGSVLVFVEIKFLVGFGFSKLFKLGILYYIYEKVSRSGPCNFNGDK